MDRLPGVRDGHRKEADVIIRGNIRDPVVLELFSIFTSGGYKPTQVTKLCRI